MTDRVVITGLGSVCGLGIGVAKFWDALCQGHSSIRPLTGFADDIKIRTGSRLEGFQPEQHFSRDSLPLLDRFSQFALLAAREAVEDAGLAAGGEVLMKAAAIIGTGCGGKQTDEETYTKLYKEQRQACPPADHSQGYAQCGSQHGQPADWYQGSCFLGCKCMCVRCTCNHPGTYDDSVGAGGCRAGRRDRCSIHLRTVEVLGGIAGRF